MRYRALSFAPPAGWSTSSTVHLGDASEEEGRVVLGVEVEERPPSETLDDFTMRKVEELREDREDFTVVRSGVLEVDGRRARLVRVRYRSARYPLGPIDHVIVLVDRDPRSWTLLFMQVLESHYEQRAPAWSTFVEELRLDEAEPKLPRIRPHDVTFEPPAQWAEEVAYAFRASEAKISLVLEASEGPFRAFVDAKLEALVQAKNELVESVPALAVDGRDAARIRVRREDVEELIVVVDGGGTSAQRAVFTAPPSAEGVLATLVESVRIVPTPGPMPRRPYEPGGSTRDLVLQGKPPNEVHAELMRRGFVPTRVPLAAPTTRAGQRRFFLVDGRATASLADPRIAAEVVYAHPDGGVVRVFPHGHPSPGLGGVDPGSARISVRYSGSRDLGIDAEEAVIGRLGVHPRTVAPADLPGNEEDASLRAFRRVRDTWSLLGPGEPVSLPIEDRVGLRVTRTVVVDQDFDAFAARVERLSANAAARQVETDERVRFVFAGSRPVPCAASVVLDHGAEVLSVDPIGEAASVDRLQRFLHLLLRDGRYRVFDDATGEDVTATVVRLPSFLVAPTRRRPELFTSAG